MAGRPAGRDTELSQRRGSLPARALLGQVKTDAEFKPGGVDFSSRRAERQRERQRERERESARERGGFNSQ